MTRTRSERSTWALAFTAVLACSGERPSADAVAQYDGGEVTATELEAAIVALPLTSRQAPDGDDKAWHEEIARELAIRELVLSSAQDSGTTSDTDFLADYRHQSKRLLVAQFLAEQIPPAEPLLETDLETFFAEHADEYQQDERRQVLNIFRRRQPGTDDAELRQELRGLRDRVLAGENFSLLASSHSHSESRHRHGLVGTFTKGQLPPALENVVFGLALQTPSEPIVTRDGGHLFWVERIQEGKAFELDEIRAVVADRLQRSREHAALMALDLEQELPPGSYVPQPDELQPLLGSGDQQSLMLRIGDFEVRANEFLELLQEEMRGQAEAPTVIAERLLERLHQHEMIYLRCLQDGLDRRPQVKQDLDRLFDDLLFAHALDHRLAEAVEADQNALRRYYRDNQLRFGEPLRLRLERLRVPLGNAPSERMARLELARFELDGGDTTLEALSAEFGGEVDTLGWRTIDQLHALRPEAASMAAALAEGKHTAPLRTVAGFELLRVVERGEPAPQPFERVQTEVVNSYLEHHGQGVYADFGATLLERRGFRMLE